MYNRRCEYNCLGRVFVLKKEVWLERGKRISSDYSPRGYINAF